MLHYRSIGTGKPIIVLHGVGLDHRYMMDGMEPGFRATGAWNRIYVDLPGHGRSPARDDICSQDDLLNAVMAFVDEMLGQEPFALVGLLRGSYIARGLVHLIPQRITGTALIVPGGNPSSDPARLPNPQILGPDDTILPDLSEG